MSVAGHAADQNATEPGDNDQLNDGAEANTLEAPTVILPEELDGEEGELGATEIRGHDATHTGSWSTNAFHDSYVSIENLIVGGSDRVAVSVADVSRATKFAAEHYAEPEYYAGLVSALSRAQVVLLVGASCGKRTSASVALRAAGHSPILQLSSEVPPRSLVDAIEKLCKRSQKAGIIVEAVDRETLTRLMGFEMLRLKDLLADGARVVITATPSQGAPARVDGVSVVQCSPPQPEQVLDAAPGSTDVKDRARAALTLLSAGNMTPADVIELVNAAENAAQTPEELAQAFDGKFTSTVLSEWLRTERSAKHLACLTAGAVLEDAPGIDVDLEAEVLADRFSAGLGPPSEGIKTFGLTNRGWPEGVLEVAHAAMGTHFGYHEVEVIRILPPHNRERIIQCLWQELGADFRQPFTRWLRDLAGNANSRVRLGAAVSAGVLFTVDPVLAERELLRPWALENTFSTRLCAAVALGAPVATGADRSGARALARAWGTSPDLRLRHVAVLAYGGTLGAWDEASAAPMHLWQIASESPELARAADVSLASLMTAGASASRTRANVLSLLRAQAQVVQVPARVHGLMPLILRHLTARGGLATESLNALANEPSERQTLESLGELLALTLLAPSGYESAARAVATLLRAVADARVEQTTALAVIGVIRESSQDPKTARAIDARLRRALSTSARGRDATADAARAVLKSLFPTS